MDKEQIMLNNALVLAKQKIEAHIFTDICYDLSCSECSFNERDNEAYCVLKERIHNLDILIK